MISPSLLVASLFALPVLPEGDSGYRLPHPDIQAIVDTPPAPGVRLSPSGEWMLLGEFSAMPPIRDLARRPA